MNKNKNTPAISVLMPVYNAEKFLKEAIDSILSQTFTDFEFIIIDDGSTDRSIKIIEKYLDSRIRFIKRDHQGYVPQLNYGLSIARSEIIARMDADDISLPSRFELQYMVIKNNLSIGVISSSVQLIDINGKKGAVKWFPSNNKEIKELFPVFCPISHPASMYRKSIILSVGGYNEKLAPAEDYDLWLRLFDKTQFANVESPQLLLRKHNKEVTKKMLTIGRQHRLNLSLQFIEKQLASVNDLNKQFSINIKRALCYYYHGSVLEARKLLFILYIQRPWKMRLLRFLFPTFLGEKLFQRMREMRIFESFTNIFRLRKHLGKYISP